VTEDIERAFTQYDASLSRIMRMAGGSVAPVGARRSAELQYGQSYQRLVRLGAAAQIRGKYRGL
jgi:hypothetical protein